MARLIIKNGYIKSNRSAGSGHKSHLVQYIATRDGVQKIKSMSPKQPATPQQQKLVTDLLQDMPGAKDSYEYGDYLENPTSENASEFIATALEQVCLSEQHREKYLDYIANRPRVEILEAHGLFNGHNEKIVLADVVKEIVNHQGNVWTPIISLKREDAQRTDCQSAESRRALLSSKVFDIAACMKIHPDHFRWYAAFHDEGHHPHVHMICYSTNPNEGYLSKPSIEKMKSILVNEIFKQELTDLYASKTLHRDTLKREAEFAIATLKNRLQAGECFNPKLEWLLIELNRKLQTVTGKKQYGYLRPPLKKLVDAIVDELATQPEVNKVYELWQEMQKEIYRSYQDVEPDSLPLSMQKEFKSIKNMIIREADGLVISQISQPYVEQQSTASPPTAQAHQWQNPVVGHSVLQLFYALAQTFQESYHTDSARQQPKIDSKLIRKMREKKLALGQKTGGQQLGH